MWRWLPVLALLAACGGEPGAEPGATPAPPPSPSTSSTPSATPSPTVTVAPTPSPTKPSPTEKADPRWRFFTPDRTRYSSSWFEGRHRVMIGYGCTSAPYYDPDPRCSGRRPGFHHGIDVAMPCGTPLFAAVDGVVLDPTSSGAPGAAYGERPFRIRTGSLDVLVGHARQVFVEPGDRVRKGQRIALASDSGAPDGCHLHFEVRRQGGGVRDASNPAGLLRLKF